MNLILLGAPGAGKGTLASYLIEKMGVPSVSTGNILREAIANKTELGQKAKAFMDAGQLVPDQLVIDLLAAASLRMTAKTASSWTASRAPSRRPRHSTRSLLSTARCRSKSMTRSSKAA